MSSPVEVLAMRKDEFKRRLRRLIRKELSSMDLEAIVREQLARTDLRALVHEALHEQSNMSSMGPVQPRVLH